MLILLLWRLLYEALTRGCSNVSFFSFPRCQRHARLAITTKKIVLDLISRANAGSHRFIDLPCSILISRGKLVNHRSSPPVNDRRGNQLWEHQLRVRRVRPPSQTRATAVKRRHRWRWFRNSTANRGPRVSITSMNYRVAADSFG